MAITALFTGSSPNPSSGTARAGTRSVAAGEGTDFASLFGSQLTGQIAGQLAGQAALQGDAVPSLQQDGIANVSDQAGISTTDPALMWLAAALQPLPTQHPPSPSVTAESLTSTATGIDPLPDLSWQANGGGQSLLLGGLVDADMGGNVAALLNGRILQDASQTSTDSGSAHLTGFSDLLAAQQQASTQATTVNRAADPEIPQSATTLPLQTPLHESGWADEMGQRLVWMSRNETQQAQLTLNPPHLGPIQVSLSLNNEQLTAQFVSASPEVRQTLEESLPRLREMLAESGISLGQTQVGSESFRQPQQTDDGSRQRGTSRGAGDNAILGTAEADGVHVATIPQRGGRNPDGTLDLFV